MGNVTKSKLWIQLPGNSDNGTNLNAYDMFGSRGDSWPTGLSHVEGIIIRSTSLRNGMFEDTKGNHSGSDYLQSVFLPFLRQNNIKLAINAVGAGRSQCDGRDKLLAQEREEALRIINLGGKIDVFRLQSIISGTIHTPDCMEKYPKNGGLERRLEDVVRFMDEMKSWFPDAEFIISDTAAAKTDAIGVIPGKELWNYRASYSFLLDGVRALGHDIHGFHLAWATEEMAPDASDVADARDFFNEKGIKWGIVYATDNGNVSAKAFYKGILAGVNLLKINGIYPHDAVVTSWKTFPQILIPENKRYSFTHVIKSVINTGIIDLK